MATVICGVIRLVYSFLEITLEETNLEVEVTKFIGSEPDVYGDKRQYTLNLGFLAKVIGGQIRPLSDVASLKWFEIDELPETMAFAHQRKLIDLLRKKIGISP